MFHGPSHPFPRDSRHGHGLPSPRGADLEEREPIWLDHALLMAALSAQQSAIVSARPRQAPHERPRPPCAAFVEDDPDRAAARRAALARGGEPAVRLFQPCRSGTTHQWRVNGLHRFFYLGSLALSTLGPYSGSWDGARPDAAFSLEVGMIENQKIRPAQVIGLLGEPLTLDLLPPPSTTRWVAAQGGSGLGGQWRPAQRR